MGAGWRMECSRQCKGTDGACLGRARDAAEDETGPNPEEPCRRRGGFQTSEAVGSHRRVSGSSDGLPKEHAGGCVRVGQRRSLCKGC